jgi:hypothetical protein
MRVTSSELYAGGVPAHAEGRGSGKMTSNLLQLSFPSFAQLMLLSPTVAPYPVGHVGCTVPEVPALGVLNTKSRRNAVQVMPLSVTVPPGVVGQAGCVVPEVPPELR